MAMWCSCWYRSASSSLSLSWRCRRVYSLMSILSLLFIALLFGALFCVTGPTVIMPLLRSVRPNKTISNILKWEGIIIDPIGAIMVVLVHEYIVSGSEASSI